MNKRPRLDDTCYIGLQRYFLTFCADFRHAAFTETRIVGVMVQQLLRAAGERQFAVIAYVFMPDHFHVLVEALDAASDLQDFAHHAKQLTGFAYKQLTQRKLWQPSYWDRVLRDDEATWDVVRYICDNPVRKGLVVHWQEYAFTGSGTMSRDDMAQELASRPTGRWQP